MAGVSTKEIKTRIRSMESTKQITKAMEMVASSKLRHAQARVQDSRPYFEILHGTIGDIVSLTGENRILVKNGLENIKKLTNKGITALLDSAGIKGNNKLSAGKISFTVVPRINACGRLALSEKSVELLITDDNSIATQIAGELSEDNKIRQDMVRRGDMMSVDDVVDILSINLIGTIYEQQKKDYICRICRMIGIHRYIFAVQLIPFVVKHLI